MSPTQQVNTEYWISKAEAAEALGVAPRTIERAVERRQLRQEWRRRPGKRPEPVYDPAQIETLKAQQAKPVPPPQSVEETLPARRLPDFVAALREAVTAAPRGVAIMDKVYLNIKEASALSGLPKATIRRMVQAGELPAIKAGGWRIRRGDVEKL